jgi:hypothetical protein
VKQIFSLILITILITFLSSISTIAFGETTTSLGQNPLTLPAGTLVKLVFLEQVNSQRNNVGDEIVFAISEDVIIMDKLYLVAGTPVIGRVKAVKPAKSWGRQGTMDIEILSIIPVYSETIPLTFETDVAGGSEKAESIGAAAGGLLLLGPAAVFAGSTISGSSAIIEAGTEIIALTAEDAGIRNISADSMAGAVDEWTTAKVIDGFLDYSWEESMTVAEAFDAIAHEITEDDITIEELEDYYYQVTVQVTSIRSAIFKLRPFEEPYLDKFITLEAMNDLAENMIKVMK